jgi:hypothetical protein
VVPVTLTVGEQPRESRADRLADDEVCQVVERSSPSTF